jgi:hypothetical protein
MIGRFSTLQICKAPARLPYIANTPPDDGHRRGLAAFLPERVSIQLDNVFKHRTDQPQGRDSAKGGRPSGMLLLNSKQGILIQNVQVNINGAMGLASVVKSNLGAYLVVAC